MSSGGGSTTTQQLPAWLENAAKENLSRAKYVSQIGYVPNYGLDVAAFTPMQQSAFQNTADAASAFGMGAPVDAMAGMPQATTNAQGFTGYSSGNMFDQALQNLQQRRPAQYDAMQGMFVNPQTGQAPSIAFTPSGSVALGGASPTTASMADYTTDGLVNTANSYDYGQMGAGAEDFWLGLATSNIPVLYGLGNMVAGNIIDKRMEAIQDQIDTTYDLSQQGILTAIDESGNVVNTFSPATWDSPLQSDAPSWDLEGNVYDGGGWSSADDTTGGYTMPPHTYDEAGLGLLNPNVSPSDLASSTVTPLPTPEWDYDPFADTSYFDNTVVPSIQQATPSGQVDPNYTATPTGSTSVSSDGNTTATYTSGGGGLTLSGGVDGQYTVPDAYVSQPSSDSSSSSSSKIVCTAMNERYGFGSFRNAIWLKYSADHLKPEHEIGYHAIFLPLVDYGFKQGDGITHRIVRKTLEHIAKHRTADLRAEMKGRKRHTLGRAYRFVLEPLCYLVGKVKGE